LKESKVCRKTGQQSYLCTFRLKKSVRFIHDALT